MFARHAFGGCGGINSRHMLCPCSPHVQCDLQVLRKLETSRGLVMPQHLNVVTLKHSARVSGMSLVFTGLLTASAEPWVGMR